MKEVRDSRESSSVMGYLRGPGAYRVTVTSSPHSDRPTLLGGRERLIYNIQDDVIDFEEGRITYLEKNV